ADGVRYQIGGAADGDAVHGFVLLDRLDADWAAFGFADHADEAGLFQHRRGEPVHARSGGGAGGADDFVAHRVDRADVVDEAVGEIDWQLLALVQDFDHALVRGIATRKEFAGEQQAVAGFPAGDLFLIKSIEIDA